MLPNLKLGIMVKTGKLPSEMHIVDLRPPAIIATTTAVVWNQRLLLEFDVSSLHSIAGISLPVTRCWAAPFVVRTNASRQVVLRPSAFQTIRK